MHDFDLEFVGGRRRDEEKVLKFKHFSLSSSKRH